MTAVSGTVTYRQRIALTPDAVLHVQLADVSRADAPAEVLVERTIRPEGRQVPIPFEIQVDSSRIDPSHRYVVQARIDWGGQRWISTSAYPVLTGGNPATVEVVVEPTG